MSLNQEIILKLESTIANGDAIRKTTILIKSSRASSFSFSILIKECYLLLTVTVTANCANCNHYANNIMQTMRRLLLQHNSLGPYRSTTTVNVCVYVCVCVELFVLKIGVNVAFVSNNYLVLVVNMAFKDDFR